MKSIAKKQMTADQKAFSRGFTCAVTTLIRSHGENTWSKDTWNCNSLTYKECIECKVPESDIEILLEHKYITNPDHIQ